MLVLHFLLDLFGREPRGPHSREQTGPQ